MMQAPSYMTKAASTDDPSSPYGSSMHREDDHHPPVHTTAGSHSPRNVLMPACTHPRPAAPHPASSSSPCNTPTSHHATPRHTPQPQHTHTDHWWNLQASKQRHIQHVLPCMLPHPQTCSQPLLWTVLRKSLQCSPATPKYHCRPDTHPASCHN